MTRTAVKFPDYLGRDGVNVEVQKVPAAPFYATTYAVFVDGEKVGYVASRPERGHSTLWAYSATRDLRGSGGSPSRVMAVDALLDAVKRSAL